MLLVHLSGFRPDDSLVHQLISIVHDIYNAFDANPSLEILPIGDDTSIFHVVKDPNTSAEILNHDLTRISE